MKILKRTTGILLILITASCLAFTQSAQEEIKLNSAEKKMLNTFFSNFSEVFFEPFTKEKLTDVKLHRERVGERIS